jgi:hypothetical protein
MIRVRPKAFHQSGFTEAFIVRSGSLKAVIACDVRPFLVDGGEIGVIHFDEDALSVDVRKCLTHAIYAPECNACSKWIIL